MAINKGGSRIGAGKKRVFDNPVDVNSRLEKSELELIKNFAHGKTISEKIRCVIKLGLDVIQNETN
ncbi:hypothetical protein [Cetobacterium sp.]|uniref:hypothetical protein n=1 Tax=Cetobacterium sp. TaxID=2071632 RepID=UPI002FC85F6A